MSEDNGLWAVTIPSTALMNWTEWDEYAVELTLFELSRYGSIYVVGLITMAGRKAAGYYNSHDRRTVGEALARLTALARVSGPPPSNPEEWRIHDSRIYGDAFQSFEIRGGEFINGKVRRERR